MQLRLEKSVHLYRTDCLVICITEPSTEQQFSNVTRFSHKLQLKWDQLGKLFNEKSH